MFKLVDAFEIYYFFVLILSTYGFPKVSNFETNSNSHQFIHLENLIGSVHTYAPKHVYIFVRDMGLTRGQYLLLKQYENVQVMLPTDIIGNRTQLIDVDREFVFIDGKYQIRKSNGKLLYVDSIRKRYQLAIVIPFIRSQLSNLIIQLSTSKIYKPCKTSLQTVDLIFYHNEDEQSSLQKDIRNIEYMQKCYRKIRYFAANLSEKENWHPYGSFLMWQKLLDDDENNPLSLRAYGYTHFFLMEPDTRPIRDFWLDSIIDQITVGRDQEQYLSTNWWIVGSVYRGMKMIGDRFLHINGNALYHLSANFIEFVRTFSGYYRTGDNVRTGYDLIMYTLLLKNQKLGKTYLHKFQFSDFIQNCWHTGCEGSDEFNNTYFILNNPNTYLIHGNYVPDAYSSMPNEDQVVTHRNNESPNLQSEIFRISLFFISMIGFIAWIFLRYRLLAIRNYILKYFCFRKLNIIYQYI